MTERKVDNDIDDNNCNYNISKNCIDHSNNNQRRIIMKQ